MFTSEHFVWLGICTIMVLALTYFSLSLKFSFKTASLIVAGISVLSETLKIFTHMEFANGENIVDGMVIEATALPLHLCSILVFVFIYLPFCKNEKLKKYLLNFLVPVSLIGGSIAILMATSGTDFTEPYAYQCFIYHAGIVWFAIYLIATKQVHLGFYEWRTNALSLLGLVISMIWINGALQEYDTNFCYVVRPPADGLPILNLDNGWYVYFISLLILGLSLLTLVHLPYMIKDFKKKKEDTIRL